MKHSLPTLLGALLLTGVSLPTQARARCAMPQAFLEPGAGTVLPPNPTLYFFSPRMSPSTGAPTVEATGDRATALTTTVSEVTATPAYSVYRVSIRTSGAKTISLRVRFGEPVSDTRATPFVYRVSGVGAPRATPVAIVRTASNVVRWRCSEEGSRSVFVRQAAPSYRVEWAPSETLYRAGKRSHVFVPSNMARFFGDKVKARSEHTLQLGKINCLGANLHWSTTPIYAGVAALHADGSVTAAPTVPTRVDPPGDARESKTQPRGSPPVTETHKKPSSGWGVPGECINAPNDAQLPEYCAHPECFRPNAPPSCSMYLKRR